MNCGNGIEDGEKICAGCGKEVYNTIDFADFYNTEYQSKDKEIKKFKTIVRLSENSFNEYGAVVHPEKEETRANLVIVSEKRPKEAMAGRKALYYLTCNYNHSLDRRDWTVDDFEILPLPPMPQPPIGYQEIDLFDFIVGFKKGKYPVGSKFWSVAALQSTFNGYIMLGTTDNSISGAFALTKRPPVFKSKDVAIVAYTVVKEYVPNDDTVAPEADEILIRGE